LKQKHITYRKSNPTKTGKQVSKSLLNTSTGLTHKAFRGLAKHQSETNETNNRYINIMEAQQSINFILANNKLRNRRVHRGNHGHERLVETGKEDGYIRLAWGWIVDYLIYVLSLIWGVIQPIVLILVMLVMRIVLMTVFTFLGFYILYEIITA
jgi:ABC-type multidrug transport system fused ATPase/permease subunit